MKKALSTVLSALLVFVGATVFAQEKATADVTETFASEYMPETKAFLDQIRKIRAADEALYGELDLAARLMETGDYPNDFGLKNEAMSLLVRKIFQFQSREEAVVKALKDLYFKHQAELVESEDLATQDASLAKDGAAWLVDCKDCKKMYSFRDTAPDLNANYLVIDLETFSKTALAEPPANGWSDAFKTDALVLRKVGDFWIGVFEVTQRQWEQVMGKNPSHFSDKPDSPLRPVEQVSWEDLMGFCRRLTVWSGIQKANLVFTLPLESQWERAAKGGVPGHEYSGSDNLDEVAWYNMNSDRQTHAVGTKKPNELGLYDMSGNVWELCWDIVVDGIVSYRAYRGGSWDNDASYFRSADRDRFRRSYADGDLGFRVVLAPVP